MPVEARFAITALEAVRFVLLQEREMEVRLKFDPINGQLPTPWLHVGGRG